MCATKVGDNFFQGVSSLPELRYMRVKLASWGKKFGGKVNWRNEPFFGKFLSVLYL